MGIQGMTNWKFSAFLTIALILVAGLFSSTAMAAANDGQGAISITTITAGGAAGNATVILEGTAAAPDATPPTPYIPAIVSANGNGLSLEFTFTVPVPASGSTNMKGGMVEITIPSGWTVPHASVTADDEGALIATDAEGDAAAKRIVLTKSGDNATKVGVNLTTDEWNVAADGTAASLTITFAAVTTANPSRLRHTTTAGYPYEAYEFSTKSKADKGTLRRLVIPTNGLNPQPGVRVGVVTAGKGELEVNPGASDPAVYQGETAQNITLVFTAAGPMYDYSGDTITDVDNSIAITIPDGLTAPRITGTGEKGYITVSRQSGTVLFENPNEKISVSGQVATLDISRMEKGSKIYIAYRKVDVAADAAAGSFTLALTPEGADDTVPTVKPSGEHLKTIAGSGMLTLSKDVVGAGTKPTLTFTYKAATKLANFTLFIDQPADTDPAWTDLTLQSNDSRADNYVTKSGGGDAKLDLDPTAAENQNASGTVGDGITLTGIDLNVGGTVTVRITRTTLTGEAGTDPLVPVPNGVYTWASTIYVDGGTADDGAGLKDPQLFVVGDARAGALFQIIPIATDANPSAADPVTLPNYNAASKQNIQFRFRMTTPIRNGYVKFTLPSNWAAPVLKDAAGKATVRLVTWDGTATGLVDKIGKVDDKDNITLAVSGQTITVNVRQFPIPTDTSSNFDTGNANDGITIQYGTGTGDNRGMVGPRAVDNLEIFGHFKTGSSSGQRPASAPISVRIGNVASGSGAAMITSPSNYKIKAGSDDNTIRIVYMAAGTMNGGSVRLHTPDEWGNLDERSDAKANRIKVMASLSIVDPTAISYGPRWVLVPLKAVEKGSSVTFELSKVKVQTTIGLAKFEIESAGSPSDSLTRLEGIKLPKDKDKKDITDPYMLLGKVFVPHIALADDESNAADVEAVTGILRLEVVAGEGGTGEVKLLEIIRSDAGLQDYLDDDGVVASERRVHAGDTEIYLAFIYKPIQTIRDGGLRFTVPADWTAPQENSSNERGYTTIQASGANIGSPTFENRAVTIPITDITSADSIEIHYGSGSLGATAPKVKKTSQFNFAVKGGSGSYRPNSIVDVEVGSQASGGGMASVDTGMTTTDTANRMTSTVHAGDDEGSITITYDPEGQIVNGRIKLTVPEALVGMDGVMSSHITPSSGSAKYGGSVDLDLAANKDVGDKFSVLVSSVNLDHDDMFTFTYTASATMRMPAATGDLSFTVAVDGGEGPGEVAEGMPAPMKVGDALMVKVIDAKAGSGTVMIDQMGAVVAGSAGNEIKVTYTAIGEIGEGKKITVTVPAGWSAPLTDAAAAEKMGTFTTKHYLKLAADDADGMPNAGDALAAAATMKAAGAATDADPMIMVAEVASGKMVKAGDMVKFTYTNATAPATPQPSVFTTSYDGMQVGTDADVKVIVQSAEGASMLSIESADSFMIEGDPLAVTVKLMAADNTVATRDTDTMVSLSSSASTGTFTPATVTIPAGQYMATSSYSDTAVSEVTLTASTTAEGIADGTKMVTADTANLSITSVTFAPMYATKDTEVTVTAMATPLQTAMFSVGEVVNGRASVVNEGTMTPGEPGAYSGSFNVNELHPEGMHDVTVSINGTSMMAEGKLTIDRTAPEVSMVSASPEMVRNGDTVTIKAMASDNNSVKSVMADVSMLDSTQTDKVALMMGEGDNSGYYMAEVMISEDNAAMNGEHTITITAMDAAGNSSEEMTAMVTLQNSISFTSMIPTGANLFHVPLNDPDITTVGSLRAALGDAVTSLIVRKDGGWEPDSDDVMITSSLGIYLVATSDITTTFEGDAWEDMTLSLESGANLVGLPVNDPSVTMASDISGLFADGVVISVTAGSGGQYTQISDTSDVAVAGDAAYYIVAGDVTGGIGDATLTGDGWENDPASAAPIALSGYKIGTQTPALAVYGSVTDEITGLAKEGFRVKVKNLTTKAGLSEITSVETAEGYSMAFVDLKDARAARVGDILEISADSPNPLIGVKPVRHVVTVDDVKNGRITLEDLIAYEIPAETELLRNYPNPFNPETWIPYHLSEDADVSLTIYDVNGVLVRDIDVGHQTAAKYDTRAKAIYWDGRNQFGEQVASGIYFYSLEAGDFSATRKMVIVK